MNIVVRRTITISITTLLIWMVPSVSSAQSSVIRGRVQAIDGTPIPRAQIFGQSVQNGRTITDETDRSGRFAFIGLSSGQWLFTVEKFGYEPSQGVVYIRRTARTDMSFVLEINPFSPPVPATGVLAGLRAGEIQEDLLSAHSLFDDGNFDDAIDVYKDLLNRLPLLTSLHIQIGHAYLGKRDYRKALAAYRAVPADAAAAEEAALAIQALQSIPPPRC
jgi:hypothetical protein